MSLIWSSRSRRTNFQRSPVVPSAQFSGAGAPSSGHRLRVKATRECTSFLVPCGGRSLMVTVRRTVRTMSISMLAKAAPDAAAGAATERDPGEHVRPRRRSGTGRSAWIGELVGVAVHLRERYGNRIALRDNPFAELHAGRVDMAAGEVDDGAVALHFEDGGLAVLLSSVPASATSRSSTAGCREIRSNAHASVEAVVSGRRPAGSAAHRGSHRGTSGCHPRRCCAAAATGCRYARRGSGRPAPDR